MITGEQEEEQELEMNGESVKWRESRVLVEHIVQVVEKCKMST